MPRWSAWFLFFSVAGCDVQDQLDASDQVALGKAYVAQRQCGTCHDSAAGTLAGQITPRPGSDEYASNLTPDVETGLGAWADIQIVRALRAGVDLDGEKLCPTK